MPATRSLRGECEEGLAGALGDVFRWGRRRTALHVAVAAVRWRIESVPRRGGIQGPSSGSGTAWPGSAGGTVTQRVAALVQSLGCSACRSAAGPATTGRFPAPSLDLVADSGLAGSGDLG